MNPFDKNSEYKVPKAEGNYLKFEEGDTEFIPLASPILGYEYWNTAGKPVRSAEAFDEMPEDIRIDQKTGEPEKIKHFWAFPVYDMTPTAMVKVKVLEITQKNVMKGLRNLATNAKWGNPVLKYSITVTRDDSSTPTTYTVMPNPTKITEDITNAWERAQANGFDITRLYTGGDPFKDTSNVG